MEVDRRAPRLARRSRRRLPAAHKPERRTHRRTLEDIQLTEAEAAFRALKSELAIRPIFHQKEHRVKAHILVVFLGYALWVHSNICSTANIRISLPQWKAGFVRSGQRST